MILAHNWPKTAKSSRHYSFKSDPRGYGRILAEREACFVKFKLGQGAYALL